MSIISQLKAENIRVHSGRLAKYTRFWRRFSRYTEYCLYCVRMKCYRFSLFLYETFHNVLLSSTCVQVTLKPQLQVYHRFTTWLQICYHSLLWGDSIRKGADLETQNCLFGVHPQVFDLCESVQICRIFLQGSAKIVALNLEDPYRSARSLKKCADFL